MTWVEFWEPLFQTGTGKNSLSFRAEGERGNELGVGGVEMGGREKMVRMREERGVREAAPPWEREVQPGRAGDTGRVPGRTGDEEIDTRDGWRQREAGQTKPGAGPAKPVTGRGGGGTAAGGGSRSPAGAGRRRAGRPGQDAAALSPLRAPAGPAAPARTRSLMTAASPSSLEAAVSWQRGTRGDRAPHPGWQLPGLRGP